MGERSNIYFYMSAILIMAEFILNFREKFDVNLYYFALILFFIGIILNSKVQQLIFKNARKESAENENI